MRPSQSCSVAELSGAECCMAGEPGGSVRRSIRRNHPPSLSPTGLHPMDQLSGYAHRPFRFVLRYLRQRPTSHLIILASVVAAVACSVSTQYGIKFLVDCLSAGPSHAEYVWLAFAFLISLIAADNFLWRIASW